MRFVYQNKIINALFHRNVSWCVIWKKMLLNG